MILLDRFSRRLPRWLLAALTLVAPAYSAAAQDPESIRLTAKPSVIVADGSSSSTITAEVRDRDGRLIRDEQTILFSTTLGVIEGAAKSQGGQASVSLTSPTMPGQATVTASAGHATAQVEVTFATQVVEDVEEVSSIVIRAEYLLFNDYEQTVDAVEGVDIRVGGLHIKADRAQVDLMRNTIVAQGQPGASSLTISGGDITLATDRLQYKWDAKMGYLSGISDPLRGLHTFQGATLVATPMIGQLGPETFQLRDLVPSPLAIRASRIIYIPGEEIQFSGADIMLNGKRRFSLPIHVMPVGRSRLGQAQCVGIGPRGPLLDLPYYLAAGQKGTSQLRLKYNAPEGLYGATVPGLSLDLIGKYDLGSTSDGSLELTRLTSPDWGATWIHNQNLGRASKFYVNLDTRAGYDYNSRYSLGHFSLWHRGQGYSLSLNGAATHITNTNANISASLQSSPRPLPGGFSWNTGVQVGRRWFAVTTPTEDGTTVVQETRDTQGVNARLSAPVTNIAGMRVTASMGPGLTFTNGRARRSILGTVGASRALGRNGRMNLTYNYHDFGISSGDSKTYLGFDKQTVTGSLTYGDKRRWSVSAFATVGLEQHAQNVRVSANYSLSDQWHLSASGGYFRQVLSVIDVEDPETLIQNRFGATNFEFRITRNLGERALALVYDSYRGRIYLDYMPGAVW